MANATFYPSSSVLTVFTWGRPNSPNPRLAAPIDSDDTTITFTDAPKDASGSVISSGFLMGVRNNDGYVEIVYIAAGNLSGDGLTATSCVRGIKPEGYDYTTGDSSFAASHEADSPVFCAAAQTYHRMMIEALQGTIGSGGYQLRLGDGTDQDLKWYAQNADANKPWWGYIAASDGFYFSNNGIDSTPFGTGAGVTGGDGITVTAGDIDIDVTDTTIFKNASSGASDENIVPILNSAGLLDNSFHHVMSIPAGESVDGSSTPQAVYISDGAGSRTTGRFYKADANDVTNETARFVGFITENASEVGTNYNIEYGIVGGFSGLTQGEVYFLSETAGSITATAPTNAFPVGIAISATEIKTFTQSRPLPIVGSSSGSTITIGSYTDITVDTNFKAGLIGISLRLKSADGANGNAVWYHYSGWHDGTNFQVTGIKESGSTTSMEKALDASTITAEPSGGTDRSRLDFTVNSITDTQVTFRMSNTIIAGSGSEYTLYDLAYMIYPLK